MRQLMRSKLFWGLGTLAVAASLYLALGVFGVQTLFREDEVNEDFEVAANPSPEKKNHDAEDPESKPASETTTPDSGTGEKQAKKEDKKLVAGEADKEAPAGPVAVSSGEFHPVDHAGTGTATVYRQTDGTHVLRLEGLNVENGPDLYVYAIAAPDATDETAALEAGFVSAGRLKGNVGDQTYELPPDFDPGTHRAISVWCKRFTSNFATAPLT